MDSNSSSLPNGSPPADIEFQDLNYSIKRPESKNILHDISGKFCSGELTAILGASGSGKTTLLNILAGYLSNGVTGSIKINGQPRQMKHFHKISSYIMQENLLQPYLTAKELMLVAVNLKLEAKITKHQKLTIINEISTVLGLMECLETKTECLSGGQKKRLSIAIEMVSNPPVIFLDEPTSGLDTFSIKQCVEVLKKLTRQGRTVICTMHQPPSTIFQQFQQVYFIANGMCIYNGCTSNLIPFLSSVNLECPLTHDPHEYIIETIQSNRDYISMLATATQNGKINRRNFDNLDFNESQTRKDCQYAVYKQIVEEVESKVNINFPVPFWTQFSILIDRMMLQTKRNKLMLWIQLFHHILSGALLGMLFFKVGYNASLVPYNFNYCMSVIVFLAYTYIMPQILLFPTEIQLIRREYFNRWYGLKSYFLALTFRNLPLMVFFSFTFVIITYLLTNQPLELRRFVLFSVVCLLVGFTSEGVGLAIGSICNEKTGSIIGPAIVSPLLIFAVYGLGYGSSIEPSMKILMYSSYLRHALAAMMEAIFGNRPLLDCEDEIFCYYSDVKLFLRDVGITDTYTFSILCLSFFCVVFRLIAYLALRYRLTSEFPNTIMSYTAKIIRDR